MHQCRTADGIAIEHRIKGRWYVLSEASSGYPPTHGHRSGSHVYLGVPRAIAKDVQAGLERSDSFVVPSDR